MELEAEVFLDGSMDSIADIFLEFPPPPLILILSWEIFRPLGEAALSSLSESSSISSSARTSCLVSKVLDSGDSSSIYLFMKCLKGALPSSVSSSTMSSLSTLAHLELFLESLETESFLCDMF